MKNNYKKKDDAPNHEWQVDECDDKDCVQMFVTPCLFCGRKPSGMKFSQIDRVNNKKPYRMNDIIPLCDNCNTSKSNFHVKDFISMCLNVSAHLKQKIDDAGKLKPATRKSGVEHNVKVTFKDVIRWRDEAEAREQ